MLFYLPISTIDRKEGFLLSKIGEAQTSSIIVVVLNRYGYLDIFFIRSLVLQQVCPSVSFNIIGHTVWPRWCPTAGVTDNVSATIVIIL